MKSHFLYKKATEIFIFYLFSILSYLREASYFLELLLAPKQHRTVYAATAQAQQFLQCRHYKIKKLFDPKGRKATEFFISYLFSFISYLREAYCLLEPLLAPKQHRTVYAAAAQAQQRPQASRCGVRTSQVRLHKK